MRAESQLVLLWHVPREVEGRPLRRCLGPPLLGIDQCVPLRVVVGADVPVEGELRVARLLQQMKKLVRQRLGELGIAEQLAPHDDKGAVRHPDKRSRGP